MVTLAYKSNDTPLLGQQSRLLEVVECCKEFLLMPLITTCIYDNAPCCKTNVISDWIHVHDNKFSVLEWPSQTPGPNPVERLCDVVELVNCSMRMHLKECRNCFVQLYQHRAGI